MHFKALTLLLTAAAISVSAAAGAETIGTVVGVEQGATLTRGGQTFRLERRVAISEDDVIRTDEAGSVQLIFADRTRIAVGPQSVFSVSDYEAAGDGRARRFAVDALGGTFRFLSGQSNSDAYEINTPTATMAVRGTVFDFGVAGRSETSLVTFEGRVRVCERGRTCAIVTGGCTTVTIRPRRGVETLPSPEEKLTFLATTFPFIVSQDNLNRQYRTRTWTCGDVGAYVPATQQLRRADDTSRDRDEGGYNELGDERD